MLGYEPTFVSSIKEASQLIEDGQRFDLIVCDHKPPKLDGLALLKQVRANEATATTSFVLYSNTKDEDHRAEAAVHNAVFAPQRTEDQWDDLIPQWFLPRAA